MMKTRGKRFSREKPEDADAAGAFRYRPNLIERPLRALGHLVLVCILVYVQAPAAAIDAPLGEGALPALNLSTPAAQRALQEFRRCTFDMRLSPNRRKLVGHGLSLAVPKGAIIRQDSHDAYIRTEGRLLGMEVKEMIVPRSDRRAVAPNIYALTLKVEPHFAISTLAMTWGIRLENQRDKGNRKIHMKAPNNKLGRGESSPGLSLAADSDSQSPTIIGCSHVEL